MIDATVKAPPADTETWWNVRWRWWGLGAGLAGGLFDTALLSLLGVSFAINAWDARPLIAAYFGLTFAALGYLLGALLEGRRRERRAAAIMQRQADTIAATRARLAQSEKLAAMGQLAATIAHEVRNPLGIMRSAAQTLTERLPAEGDPGRASAFIVAEIDRLASVVSSLLAFARPLQLELRPITVGELFDQAALLAQRDVDTKRVAVRRGAVTQIPAVYGDPDLLSQLVLGLLLNAAEAVEPGGTIVLDADAHDGIVRLRVTDSGPGIPPELRARIFEPFFTTRPRGTGLGLAIARHIAEAHGGRLDVDDAPAGGACFTLTLRAADGKALAA